MISVVRLTSDRSSTETSSPSRSFDRAWFAPYGPRLCNSGRYSGCPLQNNCHAKSALASLFFQHTRAQVSWGILAIGAFPQWHFP